MSVEGRTVLGDHDLWVALRGKSAGDVAEFAVRKADGSRHRAKVPLTGTARVGDSASLGHWAFHLYVFMPALCSSLGAWTVLVRPRDPLAWILGFCSACCLALDCVRRRSENGAGAACFAFRRSPFGRA